MSITTLSTIVHRDRGDLVEVEVDDDLGGYHVRWEAHCGTSGCEWASLALGDRDEAADELDEHWTAEHLVRPVLPGAELEPIVSVAEHAGPANAVEAIRWAIANADTQRQALTEQGDLDTLAAGLVDLKALQSDLGILIRAVEDNVVGLMPAKRHEVPGVGVLERRKGADRKQWQSIDLLDELLRHAAFDTETGEVIDDETILRQRIHEILVECVPFTGSLGWRVTALREHGIDPDEWCEVNPGRTTVQIHGSDR